MARALLIYNPVASRTDPEIVESITKVFAREGWQVDVAGTTRPGHADELARQGVEEGVDAVAVYGGDGTVMQAVRAVVGHEIPVGLIPAGTGNLLAGNLGIPRKPQEAARIVVRGVSRAIDLGRVERDAETHYFAVAAGAGLDAIIMGGTSTSAKRRWGMGAYIATLAGTLSALKPIPYRITVDGTTLHTDAVTVLVANCGEIIPGLLRLKEDIRFDDGFLDVVILRAETALRGIGVLGRLLLGRTTDTRQIRYARGRCITVEADEVRPVEMDGDLAGETPFTAVVEASAVRVLVPNGR